VAGSFNAKGSPGNPYSAKCPAHDDRNASLSIFETAEGAIKVKCHTGCDSDIVLATQGLVWQNLTPLKSGPREIERVHVYKYENGKVLGRKVRFVRSSVGEFYIALQWLRRI